MQRKTTTKDPRSIPVKPFHVLALDPGGTTGWSSAYWAPDDPNAKLFTLDQIHFQQGHLGPEEHHTLLDEFLASQVAYFETPGKPELEIVCESFEFRQHANDNKFYKAKVELISKEYIGVIKLFCALAEIPLTFQTASMAKTFVTDEKIKALNLWRPGMAHANDSTRHLLRYLVITKKYQRPIINYWLGG